MVRRPRQCSAGSRTWALGSPFLLGSTPGWSPSRDSPRLEKSCFPDLGCSSSSTQLAYRDSQGLRLGTCRLLERSLPAVPGFSSHPAALGLAGTSGTRRFLGGVLGPPRVFLFDLFPAVRVQRGCEGGDPTGEVEAGEASVWDKLPTHLKLCLVWLHRAGQTPPLPPQPLWLW